MPIPEIGCLEGASDAFEFEFVERESTPEPLMELSIHLLVIELSFSDTVSVLEDFGTYRVPTTVHNLMQKAGLEPEDGKSSDHVAIDETVIQLDDERFRLYAAVDPR